MPHLPTFTLLFYFIFFANPASRLSWNQRDVGPEWEAQTGLAGAHLGCPCPPGSFLDLSLANVRVPFRLPTSPTHGSNLGSSLVSPRLPHLGTRWARSGKSQMCLKWGQCEALLGHIWTTPFWTKTDTIWGRRAFTGWFIHGYPWVSAYLSGFGEQFGDILDWIGEWIEAG